MSGVLSDDVKVRGHMFFPQKYYYEVMRTPDESKLIKSFERIVQTLEDTDNGLMNIIFAVHGLRTSGFGKTKITGKLLKQFRKHSLEFR